jgi:hypothetical protein
LAFLALGGVLDMTELSPKSSSLSKPSSSESALARFFEAVDLAAGFVLRVVCVSFFGPSLPAAGFDALALGF